MSSTAGSVINIFNNFPGKRIRSKNNSKTTFYLCWTRSCCSWKKAHIKTWTWNVTDTTYTDVEYPPIFASFQGTFFLQVKIGYTVGHSVSLISLTTAIGILCIFRYVKKWWTAIFNQKLSLYKHTHTHFIYIYIYIHLYIYSLLWI